MLGFLDGPLVFGTPQNDPRLLNAPGSDTLRISFNAAEADLSFPDFSNELFSVPEGFEDFLASHANTLGGFGGAGSPPPFPPAPTGMQNDRQGHDGQNTSRGPYGGGGGGAGAGEQFFPAFSSLGLPMQQFSRTSSPTPR